MKIRSYINDLRCAITQRSALTCSTALQLIASCLALACSAVAHAEPSEITLTCNGESVTQHAYTEHTKSTLRALKSTIDSRPTVDTRPLYVVFDESSRKIIGLTGELQFGCGPSFAAMWDATMCECKVTDTEIGCSTKAIAKSNSAKRTSDFKISRRTGEMSTNFDGETPDGNGGTDTFHKRGKYICTALRGNKF